jgi:adenosylcobinamide kinase/adenosylcobinamide-phosphate guanylyltransferase
MPTPELIFLLGGARSGKSAFAERLAATSRTVTYVATGQPLDAEMATRIARHRADRPSSWLTVEAPLALPEALEQLAPRTETVIIDCLTLWISNVLLAHPTLDDAESLGHQLATRLVSTHSTHPARWIVVSNEVGLGLVPDNALARAYRDMLGRVNQTVAAAATTVYWLVAGIPMQVK